MTTKSLSCPTGHSSCMQDAGAALGPSPSARKSSAHSTLCIQQEPSHRTNRPLWNKSPAGNRTKCPQPLSLEIPGLPSSLRQESAHVFCKGPGSKQPSLCGPQLRLSQSLGSAVARGKPPQMTKSKQTCANKTSCLDPETGISYRLPTSQNILLVSFFATT